MHRRTRNTGHKNTVKKNAYTKINSCTALQNNSNSNEFTGFDMKKSKHSDLKIKKPNFSGFLGFLKKTKKPRFFKMGLDSPGIDSMAVLSNLFDPAGRTRHNHEATGRTSKLKSNDSNLLNINILYLCNCNLLKSEVIHNVCTCYF